MDNDVDSINDKALNSKDEGEISHFFKDNLNYNGETNKKKEKISNTAKYAPLINTRA